MAALNDNEQSSSSPVEIPDMFKGYNEWAKTSLGVDMYCNFVYESTREEVEDRGVFTDQDLMPQTELVRIPFESLMTLKSQADELKDVLDKLDVPIREDDALVITLLYEKFVRAADSKWSLHLEVLPVAVETVLSFTATEAEMLKGSNLYVMNQQLKKQIAQDFEELSENIFDAIAEAFPVLKSHLTFENYQWGLSMVWSRFVSVQYNDETLKSMAPVFDMFNHSPDSQMSHGFDEETNSLRLISHQRWAAGEQVFINYGALSNSKLLMLYGFVLPHNPFHHVDLYAPMSPEAPDYSVKNQILVNHGIHHSTVPFELNEDVVNEALLACIRIQHMKSNEISKCYQAINDGEMLSLENEVEVLSALIYALESMMSGYSTTLEEDADILDDAVDEEIKLNPRERMAVILRLSNKRVLTKNIDQFKERLLIVLGQQKK